LVVTPSAVKDGHFRSLATVSFRVPQRNGLPTVPWAMRTTTPRGFILDPRMLADCHDVAGLATADNIVIE